MKMLPGSWSRRLRGPACARWLERLGIDARRFWLLTDLFGRISERREMLSQLGWNQTALHTSAWILCGLSVLLTLGLLLVQPRPAMYLAAFLLMTAFLMAGMLFSETGNSLVNPVESLVLAHQPIDGATYTAAKLTHLLRILLYMVPALDGVPALAGVLLRGAPHYYPLLHLAAAFTLSGVIALFCCAFFGWLIRFVPARRLRFTGQLVEVGSWSVFAIFQNVRSLHVARWSRWLPHDKATLVWLGAAAAAVSAAIVILGLRALSGDYLARVSAIVHGGSGARTEPARSRSGELVARLRGGAGARAGFEYLSRMVRRDWHFRRQMIPMIPSMIIGAGMMVRHWKPTPFGAAFSGAHVLPHLFGVLLFTMCPALVYGGDYKGVWVFLLAPSGIFARFARGVHAWLWLRMVVAPHAIVWAAAWWFWGAADGALFTAYSLAAASLYLALEIRLIDGLPFGQQPRPSRQNELMGIMMLGGAAMVVVVGLQYFLLFHSHWAVAAVTAALAGAAWFATRQSIETFETAMRYHVATLSSEVTAMYTEVQT